MSNGVYVAATFGSKITTSETVGSAVSGSFVILDGLELVLGRLYGFRVKLQGRNCNVRVHIWKQASPLAGVWGLKYDLQIPYDATSNYERVCNI